MSLNFSQFIYNNLSTTNELQERIKMRNIALWTLSFCFDLDVEVREEMTV